MKCNLKKIAIFSFLILASSFLSGCKMESLNSPEKLVEMPVFDEKNKTIFVDLKKLTPADTEFILPQNANDVGKINFVELNGDGKEEVVVFKKKQNDNPYLGNIYMHIFKTDGKTITDDNNKIVRISGNNLKYANFVDVNGDGKKEMILQVSNKGFENVYIYEYSEDEVKKIGEYTSTGKSILLNYFDYNSDGDEECLAIVQDLTSQEASISEMVYEQNQIVFKESTKSKNVDSLEQIIIMNGIVSKDESGSVVLYQSISGTSNTQIITYKNGKFVCSLNDNDDRLNNPIVLMAADINADRVLEIPKIEFKYSSNTTNESRVVSWYAWNGMFDKESKLKLANQIFYSYDYNFKLIVPERIREDFYIRQIVETGVCRFEIYSKNDISSNGKLFDFIVEMKDIDGYEKKLDAIKENIIFETDSYVYYATNLNENNMAKYNLSTKDIKNSFYQINR